MIEFPYKQPAPELDVLWRIEDKCYSVLIDPELELYGSSDVCVEAHWYEITKRTPKGAWIGDKFVRLTATKQYACETLDKAIESFKFRKQRQIKIYSAKLKRAERSLELLTKNRYDL